MQAGLGFSIADTWYGPGYVYDGLGRLSAVVDSGAGRYLSSGIMEPRWEARPMAMIPLISNRLIMVYCGIAIVVIIS